MGVPTVPRRARKRMIEGDDRCRLREPVALDDEKPETRPERLQLGVERRGTDDERPELHAEHPVHTPVAPPATGHVLLVRGRVR